MERTDRFIYQQGEVIYMIKTFEISDNRQVIPVWFLGDIHYGHESCNIEKLQQYIQWAKKKKAYTILMGDLIENSMPTWMPETIWSQKKIPHEQIYDIIELLKPIKDKILCIFQGNHEKRTFKLTGFDITKEIAEKLGCYYQRLGGFIRIKIKNQTYNICIHHGYGASQNPRFHIQKALQSWRGMDILAIGHLHQLYLEKLSYYTPEGKESVIALRTGGFLDYPEYALERFFPVAEIGAPIVQLHSNQHSIHVEPYGLNND